jgi:hypothetical protein
MSDDRRNDGTGNDGAGKKPSDDFVHEQYRFSEEQRNAIAELASTNEYAHQSKWTTFRQLPRSQKWPFFVQHFLLATVAVLAAVIVVVSLIVTYATKAPNPVLSVQGFGVANQSQKLDSLASDFARSAGLKDSRLIQISGDMNIEGNGYTDDSTKAMAMITAGQINMVFAGRKSFAEANKRGYVSKPTEVMGRTELAKLGGSLVDADGNHVSDPAKAVGFDLSRSATWKAHGLKGDAFMAFSNVQKTKGYALRFVRYLDFS